MYTKILIAAVGLFVAYRILLTLIRISPLSKSTKGNLGIILLLIELVSLLGFILWATRKMYEAEAYVTLIGFGVLILGIIIPSRFLIGDFLEGMLLRIQRKIELNIRIEVGDISGEIIRVGYFNFDIKSKSGSIDTIPYSKIKSKVISKSGENINLEKELLHFSISSDEKSNEITERLKKTLLNSPWVASSQLPIIKNINFVDQHYEIDVYVYLLNNEYTERIRSNVNNTFLQKH